MNTSGEAFYAERDKRTAQYVRSIDGLNRQVAITVSERVARSRAGQAATLALVDMAARAHRRIRLAVAEVPIIGPLPRPASGTTLKAAAASVLAAIDPNQDGSGSWHEDEFTVEVCGRHASKVDVAACWDGGRGEVHLQGTAPEDGPSSSPSAEGDADLLGAVTSACLAAAALFVLVNGGTPRSAAVNLATRTADQGAGTETLVGPIDVGSLHVVGGGAVAHGFTYWASLFGILGETKVIDHDTAALHNTNRCMGMTAADAGWPDGAQTSDARNKAASAAANLSSAHRGHDSWYHEIVDDLPRPDLILVLANEYDVRTFVSQRAEELLLGATTGPDWSAELHRHIADVDDCPGCRFRSASTATFACSEGRANPSKQTSGDAALPFLSAAAGLMLVAALLDMTHAGQVLITPSNHWRLNLDLPAGKIVQSLKHRHPDCALTLPAGVRADVHSMNPRRWDQL